MAKDFLYCSEIKNILEDRLPEEQVDLMFKQVSIRENTSVPKIYDSLKMMFESSDYFDIDDVRNIVYQHKVRPLQKTDLKYFNKEDLLEMSIRKDYVKRVNNDHRRLIPGVNPDILKTNKEYNKTFDQKGFDYLKNQQDQ